MASVFRKRGSKKYYYSFVDEYGKRRTRAGFTSKRVTTDHASAVEVEAKRRREDYNYARLARRAESAGTLISEAKHAWHRDVEKREVQERYRIHLKKTVDLLLSETLAVTLGELDEICLERVFDIRRQRHAGETFNSYRAAFADFMKFVVARYRLESNPMMLIRGKRVEPVLVHRALTPVEFDRLLFPSEAPPHRSLRYRLAVFTGLRQQEISRLQRYHLIKVSGETCLKVTKEVSVKNMVEAILPLPRMLARDLVRWAEEAKHDAPLLGPRPGRMTLYRDLERAGIQQTDRYRSPKPDEHGRVVNYRSFRMTHNTWLEAAGVVSEVRMKLRRQVGCASNRLVLQTYSDLVQSLPALTSALDLMIRWYQEERKAVRSDCRAYAAHGGRNMPI